MIFFTSDIDWAPDEVIDDMLSIFDRYNQKCTLFATHDSSSINNAKCNHEIAIHPNFNSLFANDNNSNAERIIDNLMNLYPDSIGVRSHSLTTSSLLLDLFYKKGLKYDSNIFLPYLEVQPIELWNGFIRIPYNWEDDVHFLYKNSFQYSSLLVEKGFKIFDFHPIHVFLNTEVESRYINAKPFYQNPKMLIKYRNSNTFGARTLLISLLESCQQQNIKTRTLSFFCEPR
jgi:hypothetical protein